MITVKAKKLRHDARVPVFAKEGDACADLYACDEQDGVCIFPGETKVIYTGIALAIPTGYEGQVRARSGLSSKGIQVQLGVIDSGYRGPIGIITFNGSNGMFVVKRGDRIAQLAIREAPAVAFELADELDETSRGDTGFGSSGVR
jgi:dUTP pyrophosphatase